MVTRTMALTAALLLCAAGTDAQERTIYDDVRLEVIPEAMSPSAPFPNELVLLRIRGVYRPLINIAHLVQPSLVNFGWMNLTRDRSYTAEFGGFSATGFERTLAVFPEKSGDLVVGSFTHRLTVVDGVGQRLLEVKSPPITLEVADWQGPGGPKDPGRWWLPSSDVRVIDSWSGDPNRVPRGETIRRIVTIEADGVTAEQLPPPPVMRSAGVISFRGPVDRETRVTESGPIARAVYRWDMRPTTAHPATVEAVKVPWFDTRSRTLREATIPAQRMAWAAVGAPEAAAVPPQDQSSQPLLLAGVGGLAFLAGLAILLVGSGTAGGPPRLPPRALLRLRLAAWRRDAAATRAAVTELVRAEPELARIWSQDAAVRQGLAELDRSLFDKAGGGRPDLGRLARSIEAARRSAASGLARRRSSLKPLDGPAD